MLGSIRKFSTSIYAKILLIIIIIPFIFWGMGSSIRGGSKNVVVVIDKEKYSIQQFSDFISKSARTEVKANQIDNFLSAFIGEKLIENEVKLLGINLSDSSLRKLIKHQSNFKRENKFSRTEYEKFLLKNNITAINFEYILSQEEKKKQLLDYISGGVSPSNFMVNLSYDNINQKRSIELINLDIAFKKQLIFSEDQIKNNFENNKEKYNQIYKSIKLLELNPKNLVGNNDYSDLFFKKIDEIEDLIINGEKLNSIIQKFNLAKPSSFTINKFGKNINLEINKNIPKDLTKKIFNIDNIESTALIENDNKYFIAELFKTESIKNIMNESIKNEILIDLNKKAKRKLIVEIISEINKNNFKKYDFDKFSNDKNTNIQKIYLLNKNDDKILKKEIINQIYAFPENKVIIVNDIDFTENYLVYISKIENVTIDKKSEEYQKYLNLSKAKLTNELYNTYDSYLNKKYKIDINYQAVDTVKNYYNQ